MYCTGMSCRSRKMLHIYKRSSACTAVAWAAVPGRCYIDMKGHLHVQHWHELSLMCHGGTHYIASICRKWYHYRHVEFLQGTSSSSKSQLVHLNHIMSIMFFSGKEQFCLLWRGVIKTRGDFQSIQLKKWQEIVVSYEKSIVDWIKNLRTQWMFAGEKFYQRINVKDNQQTFSR